MMCPVVNIVEVMPSSRRMNLIVALSGSFDLNLHDGTMEYKFPLNRSYYGVIVPKMVWRMIDNFSTNSLALIIASTDYSETDYIRDFEEFKQNLEK